MDTTQDFDLGDVALSPADEETAGAFAAKLTVGPATALLTDQALTALVEHGRTILARRTAGAPTGTITTAQTGVRK